ncbi:MAG: hypothetical protein AB1767_07320 [Bacillota bacterium]
MNFLQRRFIAWSRKVERFLLRLICISLALLLAGQLLMTHDRVRYYLNRLESLEGAPYRWTEELLTSKRLGNNRQHLFRDLYWIELVLREGDGPLAVLCNGVPAGNLGSQPLLIYVHPGDLIEVSGEESHGLPAVVEVISTFGLLYPRAGDLIETGGDRVLVGWAVPNE